MPDLTGFGGAGRLRKLCLDMGVFLTPMGPAIWLPRVFSLGARLSIDLPRTATRRLSSSRCPGDRRAGRGVSTGMDRSADGFGLSLSTIRAPDSELSGCLGVSSQRNLRIYGSSGSGGEVGVPQVQRRHGLPRDFGRWRRLDPGIRVAFTPNMVAARRFRHCAKLCGGVR